ncbi:MAG: biotin--[acetyl-CoA-carboxylase] ligase [Bacteroidia bacterium]|nr:biotin--[acetyl-CoA-carboxylase] ligase [Bacteroidia bacterium]
MTLIFGKNHLHFTEITSTNQVAVSLLETKLPEGTIITALYQTQGRGQQGSVWYSEHGKNVLFSIVLYPNFLQVQKQFYLTMAMALAVKNTVQHFIAHRNVYIKWTNDILVENKKIAGILIENQIQGEQLRSSVVGIGINVNQQEFGAMAYKATSCFLETRQVTSLEYWYKLLCEQIQSYYLKLKNQQYDAIKVEYTQNLAGYHEKRHYIANNQVIEGIILGIDDYGRLAMQQDNQVKYYEVKQIEWIFT